MLSLRVIIPAMWLTSWWQHRDDKGKILWEHNPQNAHEVILARLIDIIDYYSKQNKENAIIGYHAIEQVDRLLMLEYWRRYDGLSDKTCSSRASFEAWFQTKATFPDYFRRAREKMKQMGVIDYPDHIKKNIKHKQEAIGEMMSGKH